MNNLNIGLRFINNGDGAPIEVIVPDVSVIFSTNVEVTMHALIQGYEGTPVLWEQVSGDPVQFTSPLDQPTITFITSSLAEQKFRCTTNPNKGFAYSAIGTVYHYPREDINFDDIHQNNFYDYNDPNLLTTILNIVLNKAIGNLGVSGETGISENIITATRIRTKEDDNDIYTEIGIGNFPDYLLYLVEKISLYKEENGNSILIKSRDRFVNSFVNLPTFPAIYRLEIVVFYNGRRYTINKIIDTASIQYNQSIYSADVTIFSDIHQNNLYDYTAALHYLTKKYYEENIEFSDVHQNNFYAYNVVQQYLTSKYNEAELFFSDVHQNNFYAYTIEQQAHTGIN